MLDVSASTVVFTHHHIDGVGSFDLATDARIDDDMHAGIRNGSQLTHAPLRYVLSRLQPGDRFVDVGANLGTYAIPAAIKGCRVLAIEALPDNYTLLCQSVAKNALTSVTPVHAAAFDKATTLGMTGASAWGTVSEAKDGVIVPALPLDDLLTVYGFDQPKLLKLDIEGAELLALEGLRRHLEEGKIDEIVVEVNEPACRAAGTSGEALLQALHDHDFHLYLCIGDQLVPRRCDEFRELYNCDFVATRHPLTTPPAGFTIEALPAEISVAHVLAQANGPFEPCRLYVAQSLVAAPVIVRDHPEVRAALARLQDDPIPAIREASALALRALPPPSPDVAGLAAELSGVASTAALKAPAILGSASNSNRSRRKRIAVVAPRATYCGVAHYGRNFYRHLVRAGFDAELLTFEDEVMRRSARQYRDFGNMEIADICARLESYDAFCLEFEPGTLGGTASDSLARLRRFLNVRRPVAIDFHSVQKPPSNEAKARLKSMLGLLPRRRHWRHEYQHIAMWQNIYRLVGERERGGGLTVISHTHEDHDYLTRLHGMMSVVHHPLGYFDAADRAAILQRAPLRRQQLEASLKLASTDVLLGVFGFIASHKGTHHAIEALTRLPANFKLVIFGQHHPTSIPIGQTDPYLTSLVKQIEKLKLTKRVFFIGDLGDVDFSAAIASVDLAIFPYHEVGQRSSGPIQMALDIGMPILCSRTHCFQALSRYYPDRLKFFDIGNHLQLAQLAQDVKARQRGSRPVSPRAQFNTETLIAQFDSLLDRMTR